MLGQGEEEKEGPRPSEKTNISSFLFSCLFVCPPLFSRFLEFLVWAGQIHAANVPSTQKCVFLLVLTVGCLSFTVQNDVCAEFDTKRLLSHSSSEGGKFLCAH